MFTAFTGYGFRMRLTFWCMKSLFFSIYVYQLQAKLTNVTSVHVFTQLYAADCKQSDMRLIAIKWPLYTVFYFLLPCIS